MKILLVLPAGENVRVTRERPRVLRRAMLRFSVLPLTTVAALTPPEHDVRIVDENVEPLDFDTDCDLVGVTFMTALAPRAYEIAAEFRRRGKIAVAGGYHATLCPVEAAEHFDALVVGDAEGAWERVVADVAAGRLQKVYAGSRVFGAGLPPPQAEATAGEGPTAPSARPSGLPIRDGPGDPAAEGSDPVRGQPPPRRSGALARREGGETCAQPEAVILSRRGEGSRNRPSRTRTSISGHQQLPGESIVSLHARWGAHGDHEPVRCTDFSRLRSATAPQIPTKVGTPNSGRFMGRSFASAAQHDRALRKCALRSGQETGAQSEWPASELKTPIPRRELLTRTARHYVTTNAVQAGRGCPHGCRYCSVTVFHQRTYRHRSVADVVAELRGIPRHFMFVDDNIIGDVDFARELFRAMAPLKKRWVSQPRILWRFARGVLVIGWLPALIAQTYNISGDLGDFMLTWVLLGLPVAYLLQATLAALLYLIGTTVWAGARWDSEWQSVGYWALLVLWATSFRRRDPADWAWGALPVVTLIGWMAVMAHDWTGLTQALFNLYLLALGVGVLVAGLRQQRLGVINGGMLILSALILCRFFDADLGFVVRGVVFIALGVGFLVTNLVLLRRKGAVAQ